jgi:hypothetical protein
MGDNDRAQLQGLALPRRQGFRAKSEPAPSFDAERSKNSNQESIPGLNLVSKARSCREYKKHHYSSLKCSNFSEFK